MRERKAPFSGIDTDTGVPNNHTQRVFDVKMNSRSIRSFGTVVEWIERADIRYRLYGMLTPPPLRANHHNLPCATLPSPRHFYPSTPPPLINAAVRHSRQIQTFPSLNVNTAEVE